MWVNLSDDLYVDRPSSVVEILRMKEDHQQGQEHWLSAVKSFVHSQSLLKRRRSWNRTRTVTVCNNSTQDHKGSLKHTPTRTQHTHTHTQFLTLWDTPKHKHTHTHLHTKAHTQTRDWIGTHILRHKVRNTYKKTHTRTHTSTTHTTLPENQDMTTSHTYTLCEWISVMIFR